MRNMIFCIKKSPLLTHFRGKGLYCHLSKTTVLKSSWSNSEEIYQVVSVTLSAES